MNTSHCREVPSQHSKINHDAAQSLPLRLVSGHREPRLDGHLLSLDRTPLVWAAVSQFEIRCVRQNGEMVPRQMGHFNHLRAWYLNNARFQVAVPSAAAKYLMFRKIP